MTNHNPDLKKFLVRLGVTVAAVVLVMYLAKVWFVDQRRADLPPQVPTTQLRHLEGGKSHPTN